MNAGPTLEILTGDLSGRSFRVEDAEFVIGRAPSCDLVIPKRYISREHARIKRAGGDYVIDGLSEKNPVLVKDRPARPGQRLTDGDEFEVCGIRIRFRAQGDVRDRKVAGTRLSSGSHHEEDEDAHESSWKSDPAAAAAPKRRPDPGPPSDEGPVRRGPPSDSAPIGVRSQVDEDEETTGPVRRPEPRRDESDTGPAPVQKSAARPVGSPVKSSGSVKFDEEEEDEKTKELPKNKSAVKSGSSKGSGDEGQNERTAELNKVHDPNDPDYDPFAEVDKRKKQEKVADPHREKLLRRLMVVGFVGILIAGYLLYKVTEKKPLQEIVHPTPITVRVDETVRFEEPWSKVDPPQGRAGTNRGGEPYFVSRDGVVEVEWAVPHIMTKCVFLIRGLSPGETEFALYFPESNRRKTFKVIVEGDNPHEVARQKRREDLRQKSARDLRALAEAHLASGDAFTKEREVPSRESYYRLAVVEYAKAADAALALRDMLSKTGLPPEEVANLATKAEEAESKARTDHEAFVERELARYREGFKKGATQVECLDQLQRVLRGLSHGCDVRFQRLKLILEECLAGRWQSDGTELCGER